MSMHDSPCRYGWMAVVAIGFVLPSQVAAAPEKGAIEPRSEIAVAPVGTAFTYQGKLDHDGQPLQSTCTFQFSLWDAETNGAQIGSTQVMSGVPVVAGLFTVTLDFGASAFDGNARWLQIAVQCVGDPNATALSPRQPLTPAPYALFTLGGSAGMALPFAGTINSPGQDAFLVTNDATASAAAIRGRNRQIGGQSTTAAVHGEALGTSGVCPGVYGQSTASPGGHGLIGRGNEKGAFCESFNPTGLAYGVLAWNRSNEFGSSGVRGEALASSGQAAGVWGIGTASPAGIGVGGYGGDNGGYFKSFGLAGQTGAGVQGIAEHLDGVRGTSIDAVGVHGRSTNGWGAFGYSLVDNGVVGRSDGVDRAGVWGHSWNANGFGGFFNNFAGGVALKADGRAQIRILEILGADLMEKFETNGEECTPGTVVVIDEAAPGKVRASRVPYDRKVAGVISGAGGIEHGIYLGQGSALDGDTPVAMTGRVYVKCSAENGAIRPGDLLTTAATPGHAMRASDVDRANGAVLGKAMTAIEAESGLVLVLVNLQ